MTSGVRAWEHFEIQGGCKLCGFLGVGTNFRSNKVRSAKTSAVWGLSRWAFREQRSAECTYWNQAVSVDLLAIVRQRNEANEGTMKRGCRKMFLLGRHVTQTVLCFFNYCQDKVLKVRNAWKDACGI